MMTRNSTGQRIRPDYIKHPSITMAEFADFCCVDYRTLKRWKAQRVPGFPEAHSGIGKKLTFRTEDVLRWHESRALW